jgi:hypothetical protein
MQIMQLAPSLCSTRFLWVASLAATAGAMGRALIVNQSLYLFSADKSLWNESQFEHLRWTALASTGATALTFNYFGFWAGLTAGVIHLGLTGVADRFHRWGTDLADNVNNGPLKRSFLKGSVWGLIGINLVGIFCADSFKQIVGQMTRFEGVLLHSAWAGYFGAYAYYGIYAAYVEGRDA